MGVLASLVSQAQPALFGNGVTAAGTAGATWLWEFYDVNDTDGDPIDLSGVTGLCEIVDTDDSVVVALDFDGNADGTFSLGLDEVDTVLTPGKYRWRFSLDDATDVVQVWGGSPSKFNIEEA